MLWVKSLNTAVLSMSHDKNVFHDMLGKTYSKDPVFETNGPITYGLGIFHLGNGPYKVCSSNDPRLLLNFVKPT